MERVKVEEETQKKSEHSPVSRWLSCCKGVLPKKIIKYYIFLLRLRTDRGERLLLRFLLLRFES